jgi:hypothetical protein
LIAFVLVSNIFIIGKIVYARKETIPVDHSQALEHSINSVAGNALDSSTQLLGNLPRNSNNGPQGGTVTRDAVTLLLEGKHLATGDFIELYNATQYKIVTGHLVAKVPCTDQSQSKVEVLTGEAPNFKVTDAELISELSTPGKLCLYHVDLVSDSSNTITDVAIKNNSTQDITFPASSSVGVGVNKIAPLSPG